MVPGTPEHALYVLLDSNLPTGGFVASSGLESYAKHGFLTPSRAYGVAGTPDLATARRAPGREWGGGVPQSGAQLGPSKAGPAVAEFAAAEVDNFEASTGWYLRRAWEVTRAAISPEASSPEGEERAVARLVALDDAHEATLLSHVARRASRAQGVALLTLYARGLGPPPGTYEGEDDAGDEHAHALVAGYKRAVRRGAPGHLAVCFGCVAAALGIELGELHKYWLTQTPRTTSTSSRTRARSSPRACG